MTDSYYNGTSPWSSYESFVKDLKTKEDDPLEKQERLQECIDCRAFNVVTDSDTGEEFTCYHCHTIQRIRSKDSIERSHDHGSTNNNSGYNSSPYQSRDYSSSYNKNSSAYKSRTQSSSTNYDSGAYDSSPPEQIRGARRGRENSDRRINSIKKGSMKPPHLMSEHITSDSFTFANKSERNMKNGTSVHSAGHRTHNDGSDSPKSVLSPKTKRCIQGTVDVVEDYAIDIMVMFYNDLVQQHPEYADFFPQTRSALDKKLEKMARILVLLARDLDNAKSITEELRVLHHLHASLGVQPRDYAKFLTVMLHAMEKVIPQSKMSPEEITNHWRKLLKEIANMFAWHEDKLYQKADLRGWRGYRPMTLVRKKKLSPTVTTFVFECDRTVAFRAGQYMRIKVPSRGRQQLGSSRAYVVTSRPGEPWLACTVKRMENGEVSTFLHDHVHLGEQVHVTIPYGPERLDMSADHVFLSAGIGITANRAKLQVLPNAKILLVAHVDKMSKTYVLKERIDSRKLLTHYTMEHGGRMNPLKWANQILFTHQLQLADLKTTVFHLSGPRGWMKEMMEALEARGVKNIVVTRFEN